MPGYAASLGLGVRTLQTHLQVLDVIGHNIANINRENYSRQSATVVAAIPENSSPGQLGRGVQVSEIVRAQDEFTLEQLEVANQSLEEWSTLASILEDVEGLLNEPSDDGLNKVLSNFWNSWQDLSNNPEDKALRVSVREQGENLVTTLRNLANDFQDIQDAIDDAIDQKVSEVNTISAQIADLNDEISQAESSGRNANDLRDERERLVVKLKGYLNVDAVEQTNSMLLVKLGAALMVVDNGSNDFSSIQNETTHNFLQMDGSVINPEKGEIEALIDVRDNYIEGYLSRLDTLSQAIIEEVNKAHCDGIGLEGLTTTTAAYTVTDTSAALNSSDSGLDFYNSVTSGSFEVWTFDEDGVGTSTTVNISGDLSGTTYSSLVSTLDAIDGITAIDSGGRLTISSDTGGSFGFSNDSSNVLSTLGLNVFFSGNSARTIAVNSAFEDNVSLISSGTVGADGYIHAADNTAAVAISEAHHNQVLESNTQTLDDYYQSTVTLIGKDTQNARQRSDNLDSIVSLIKERRQQRLGVSLDEEMISMIQTQQAFGAIARFVTAIQDLTQTVVEII